MVELSKGDVRLPKLFRYRRNNRMGQGRLVPQLLGWGTNNVLVSPNFLAVVFKKKKFHSK